MHSICREGGRVWGERESKGGRQDIEIRPHVE